MGNCQTVDAASMEVKHPDGRIERLYYPVMASEVMGMNQGHYVTQIIPLSPVDSDEKENDGLTATVRFTRVKLLRPTDTLSLGHSYRLVTTEEVMRVLRGKKYEKTRKQQRSEKVTHIRPEKAQISSSNQPKREFRKKTCEVKRHEGSRARTKPMNSKSWCPSLNSISESAVESCSMQIK